MVFAILYLPVDPWIRAFLGLGLMYLTTSAFTLAKCVRDAQENLTVVSRIDQARVDKILAEHDPFRHLLAGPDARDAPPGHRREGLSHARVRLSAARRW